MRQGHILYSLYGHEGAANTVSFSPSGDYFTTSGADSIVMCWKSNLNEFDTEIIDDIGGKASNTAIKTLLPQSAPPVKARPASARGAGVVVQASGVKPALADPSPTKSLKKLDQTSVRSFPTAHTPATHQ